MSAGPTAVITTLCVGGMATETPEPARISGATRSAYGRPVRAISAIQVSAPANTVSPAAMSARSPNRRISVPANGAITMRAAHPGASRRPVLSGP